MGNVIAALLRFFTVDLAGALTKAYEAKLTAQTSEQAKVAETVIADINRQIEAQRASNEVRLATAGYWEMRLATAVIAWTVAAHFALVGIDTMRTDIHWGIPPLPKPMDEWEGAIVLSLFGLQVANKGIGALVSAIRRK